MIKSKTNMYHFKYLIKGLITTYRVTYWYYNNITITSAQINIYFLQFSVFYIDMIGF